MRISESTRIAVGILGIILAGCASQPHQDATVPPAKPAPAPVQPPPSPAEQMVKTLKARAEGGDMSAATCLGGMYMTGAGVGRDPQLAGTYIGEANGQNYPEAEVLEAVLVTGSPGSSLYVLGAERQVEDLAKQGNPAAETYMGIQTRYGSHLIRVKGDLAASAHWLQLAAAQDDAYGEAELAAAYKHGWGVPQDPALAKQWSEKAGHHGFDCIADYARVVQSLVQANVAYPLTLPPSLSSEQVLLRLPLNGAAGVQPAVVTSSG